jgi:hypothetical protein
MSGEQLTITFQSGAGRGNRLHDHHRLRRLLGRRPKRNRYDFVGSFPQLYGPAGTSQNLASTLITASGVSTGVTLGCSLFNRWEV